MNDERPIWEQRPNEPDAAYARFLLYRNLGPGRSLERAYAVHSGATAEKGGKRRRAPGQWERDYKEYEWRRRAERWDISNLRQHGRDIALNFIALLRNVSTKTLEGLESVHVNSWSDAIAGVNTLGAYISADAITAISEEPEGGDDSERNGD